MTSRTFSDHVLRESALTMTAEQFSQAVGQPLQDVLRRAKAAGIEMRRDPTPLQGAAKRHAQAVWDIATKPRQSTYTKIAQNIDWSREFTPAPCVWLPLLSLS